jgi:hypothetical protein
MTKHTRDLERLLAVIARQADARLVELRKTSGNHVQAKFDRWPQLDAGSPPGDWRAAKNFRSQVKRALRKQ